MTQPKVTNNELDGTQGILPPNAQLLAVVGISSAGTANVPTPVARVRDLQAAFGGGPLVEAAAHAIETYGLPVLACKAANGGGGATVSAITPTAAGGGATVTVHASPAPIDDYELQLKIVKGGTVGTAGITYQTSLDGGRTWNPVQSLGTATSVTFPDSAGVQFDIGTGTLTAGDLFAAVAKPNTWDTTTLLPAINALRDSAARWGLVHVTGPIDAAAVTLLNTCMAGMLALGKPRAWVGNTRMPNAGESEAAYLTALTADPGQVSNKYGSLYAGACKIVSSVSGRRFRKPAAFVAAAREASVSEEIDIADVNLGALPCTIRDTNGNADEHDETLSPGLDDARFATLRTWDGDPQGVYINRPRLFSPDGSDFYIMPHRRVINLAHTALRAYFVRRLSKPVLVSRTTGLILESDALDIETGARAVLRAVLLAKPKASAIQFTLSRNDNLLSTKTMNGSARIVPLAYPEFINLDVGYFNPALTLTAV